MSEISLLYRGPLSSCNYDCSYCPFGKTRNTRAELADDAARLERFVKHLEGASQHTFGVLFTPWGEALIRSYYQDGLSRLSQMPHVRRVAIQTNLTCSLGWTEGACLSTLALWTTFHPTQTRLERFVERVLEAHAQGVRLSVGVVGLREHFEDIERLREAVPQDIYVWINAYKREPDYYGEADIERLVAVDPLFVTNTVRHPSLGMPCRAGESVFSVDGDGELYRCHFIKERIGNLYEPGGLERAIAPRLCTQSTCGCHIGYVHLPHLELYPVYGDGVLERIPHVPVWR